MSLFLRRYLLSSVCSAPVDRRGAPAPAADVGDPEPDDADPIDDAGDPEPDDADPIDDAGDPEPDDADPIDDAGDPEPEPRGARSGRAEQRIQTLAREKRDLENRLADMERRFTERSAPAPQPERELTPAQEAALLADMTPTEQVDYKLNRALGRHAQETQRVMFGLADQSDRTAFQGVLAAKPSYQRYAQAVEERLAVARQHGGNPSREQVLIHIIGERVYTNSGKPGKSTPAARRVARETTRPGNGRDDVRSTRGRQGQTAEDRLDGMQI